MTSVPGPVSCMTPSSEELVAAAAGFDKIMLQKHLPQCGI